jgi:very-short-patch-repair endonuclease
MSGNGNRARADGSRPEAVIAALAERQHGVVSRAQLLRAGIKWYTIDHLIKTGQLKPVHRGVYRVGPVISTAMREMAAVLAFDGAAVVSHGSAAALWGHAPPRPAAEAVDVIVYRRGGSRRSGIRVHRLPPPTSDEVTHIGAVPVTSPARTLLDYATVAGAWALERAVARADRENRVGITEIAVLLARHPGHRGAQVLRALIRREDPPAFTRSEAEERLLDLIRKAQIRVPESNVALHGYEVDFFWRAERLVVEVDGFTHHQSRHAFEVDRRRDALLAAAGIRVLRVTWRQLVNEAEATLVRMAQALAR